MYCISSSGQPTKCGLPPWGFGRVLTTSHLKHFKLRSNKTPRTRTDSLVLPKQWKMDMKFGAWKVRNLYGADSPTAAARELAGLKIDLVCVQEVRWDKKGTVRAEDYIFFRGKGNENHQWEEDFFTPQNSISS